MVASIDSLSPCDFAKGLTVVTPQFILRKATIGTAPAEASWALLVVVRSVRDDTPVVCLDASHSTFSIAEDTLALPPICRLWWSLIHREPRIRSCHGARRKTTLWKCASFGELHCLSRYGNVIIMTTCIMYRYIRLLFLPDI